MTARTYLMQYQKLRRDIARAMNELEEMESTLTSLGVSYEGERVQTSQSNRTEDAIIRLIDYRQKIIDKIIALKALAEEIEQTIELLPDDKQKMLLKMRVLDGESYKYIASVLGYTEDYIGKMYREAEKAIDGILMERRTDAGSETGYQR